MRRRRPDLLHAGSRCVLLRSQRLHPQSQRLNDPGERSLRPHGADPALLQLRSAESALPLFVGYAGASPPTCSSVVVGRVRRTPPIDVHALDAARAIVHPLESIAADGCSLHCASDESGPAAGLREHDVDIHRGREPRHASAMKRTSLELVLDDEDAIVRRTWCPADAKRSPGAPSEECDRHGCTMLATALKPH